MEEQETKVKVMLEVRGHGWSGEVKQRKPARKRSEGRGCRGPAHVRGVCREVGVTDEPEVDETYPPAPASPRRLLPET